MLPILDLPRPPVIEEICRHEERGDNFAELQDNGSSQHNVLSRLIEDAIVEKKGSSAIDERYVQPTKIHFMQLDRLRRKRGFNATWIHLEKLYRDIAEYDEEFLRPTLHAINTAKTFLYKSGLRLRGSFPRAWASTDGQGGLSLNWRNSGRKVTLFVPSKQGNKIRILYKSDSERGVIVASPMALMQCLMWLNNTESAHV